MTTTTTAAFSTRRFWIRAGALSLILWPIVHFSGFITSPPGQTHEPAVFREHATLVQVSGVLLHYGAILLVGVVLTLAWLVRDRTPRLSAIAGLVGALAAVNGSGLLVSDFYDLALAFTVPDAQAVAVTDTAQGYAGILYGFLLPGFLLHPALIALAVAAVRAGRARWWQPALLVAGLALPFLTISESPVVQSLGPALIAVALIPMGARLLVDSSKRPLEAPVDNSRPRVDMS